MINIKTVPSHHLQKSHEKAYMEGKESFIVLAYAGVLSEFPEHRGLLQGGGNKSLFLPSGGNSLEASSKILRSKINNLSQSDGVHCHT